MKQFVQSIGHDLRAEWQASPAKTSAYLVVGLVIAAMTLLTLASVVTVAHDIRQAALQRCAIEQIAQGQYRNQPCCSPAADVTSDWFGPIPAHPAEIVPLEQMPYPLYDGQTQSLEA